ncbi:hypothetical protein Fot_56773 [Forsythia ovata]|uniref:Uncharacterized protein n=1 Tax=Forsythia ovata TaxID=205694 RepID=A0ABD1NYC2_9LAMI
MATREMLTIGSEFSLNDVRKYVDCDKHVFDQWTLIPISSPTTTTNVAMKSKKRRRSGKGINNSIVELASGIKELVGVTILYLTTLINVLSKEEADILTKVTEELYKIEGLST